MSLNFEQTRRLLKVSALQEFNKIIVKDDVNEKKAEELFTKTAEILSDLLFCDDPAVRAGAARSPYFIHFMKAANAYCPDTEIVNDLKNKGTAEDKGISQSDVSQNELKSGINVEAEHIKNQEIQKEIALDHLAEDPKYYTKLKKMEKGAALKAVL